MAETITSYPTAYTTSGSIKNTNYKNAIGKGSDNTATGNDYASSSGNTASITYSFDFSAIPENAVIESVVVKAGGHAENATYTSGSKMCELQLYAGSTAKGTKTHFTKTSKQVLTLDAGTWTRDELQNAKLTVTIGYYGGLLNGADFTVTYSVPKSSLGWCGVAGAYKEIEKAWVGVDGAWKEVEGLWRGVDGAWKGNE